MEFNFTYTYVCVCVQILIEISIFKTTKDNEIKISMPGQRVEIALLWICYDEFLKLHYYVARFAWQESSTKDW